MNLLINLTYHHRIDSECKYIDVILVTYVTHSAQPTQAKQEMVVVRHFRPMAAKAIDDTLFQSNCGKTGKAGRSC